MDSKTTWGFTAQPDCDNCDGTGVFSLDDDDRPYEPCAFCLEDAILSGEIDGWINDVPYEGGRIKTTAE